MINLWIPLAYIVITNRLYFGLIMAFLCLVSIAIDFGRLRVSILRKIFTKWFNPLLKPEEIQGHFTGATWVFLGATVTVILFPRSIAILSLFFLFLGDPMAAITGTRLGRIRIFHKSLEGFLGGLLVCFLIAWVYPAPDILIRMEGAAMAMLIEIMPFPIDDNFLIPVGSAFLMWLAVS